MKKYILSVALLSFILISCNKEISVENVVDSPASNDSITLSKIIYIDTSQASGLDTLEVLNFKYNNAKRLIESDEIYYDIGIPDGRYKTVLFYNGTDTLPYKKTTTFSDLPSGNITDLHTGYYTYSNGKVIFDSVVTTSYPYPVSRRYTYLNDKIIVTNYLYDLPTPWVTTQNIYFTKNNGNTILQKDTVNVSTIHMFSFQYDNKNNPFYGLQFSSIEGPVPYYFMETHNDAMVFEKNNPTDINQFENSYNFHYKYYYEYNANGYPKVARVHNQNDPTNFFKMLYFYTKL